MSDPLLWGYATSLRRIDQRIYRLATVVEATEILGITPDPMRTRFRRGILRRSPPRRQLPEKAPNPYARWLRMPNKTSLRQLRVDLGHAVRSAPHRSIRFP